MAQAIVNKLLHGPTMRLKASATSGDGTLPSATAALFGLEEPLQTARARRGEAGAPPATNPETNQ
jgi:glutamyl-tRNA reductase